MREIKYHAYLDSEERTILLHSLVELKNQLIQQGRYTDCVDELIVKVINAPVWKVYLYIFYNEYEKWEMEAACFGMNLSKIS